MSTPTADAPAVELRGVVKEFHPPGGETVRAVAGIDLTVARGEVVAVLGPNGAGKTTTLDMILGLTRPTDGRLAVDGAPPRDAVRAGRVGAVLQTGGLLRDLTVRETVHLVAATFPHPAPVEDVLRRAGLQALAGRRVGTCSGGEQQRLRFALALLPDPDLLVLDEPTAGMDVAARHRFWDTMRADAEAGRTVLFATHYLEEADAFAERIVMFAGGRVVADGTTGEIRARASGRTVTARVPVPERAAARLRDLPAVDSVAVDGGRVRVSSRDSDTVARVLLGELGAADLEITAASLDQAFTALTEGTLTEGAIR
ncbi:ABC transporter ATP-binding protein [Georgenia sp. TF02-10]|uniref:ABC transporter ATP-binding protein n=1 Tax=Georgenia sp. TF02-10 TaxID=2917725 RepID=UPI001FA7A40E|nr:ABC transporter ATP-binding protein [Georgenia sp. TF02-10]UNX55770.1 ABC transporter ATP-binding protein [Georgenia sp. TF02-10]